MQKYSYIFLRMKFAYPKKKKYLARNSYIYKIYPGHNIYIWKKYTDSVIYMKNLKWDSIYSDSQNFPYETT